MYKVVKASEKRFREVVYNDKEHTYKADNSYLLSVTSLIGLYKHPFVGNSYQTQKTRDREGMTHDEVIAHWKDMNDKSKTRGTWIHFLLDEMIAGMYSLNEMKKYYRLTDETLTYLRYYKQLRLKGKILSEQILYSLEYGIAGQTDLAVIRGSTIDIYDWKTNIKTLNTHPYSNFKFPLQDIPCTKINEYKLQLEIYMFLAVRIFKKKPGKITIVHFRDKDDILKYVYPYDETNVLKLLKNYASRDKTKSKDIS